MVSIKVIRIKTQKHRIELERCFWDGLRWAVVREFLYPEKTNFDTFVINGQR
jgi:hypothetical protein